MIHWRVVILAGLTVLLIAAGLAALILPDDYEGAIFLQIDPEHALRYMDVLGLGLLLLGSFLAWRTGLMWQGRMYGDDS